MFFLLVIPAKAGIALRSCLEAKRFALRASHFSLNGKEKVTKRKPPYGAPGDGAAGSASRPGNFRKAHPAPTETAHIHVRRPCGVCPVLLAAPHGILQVKSKKKQSAPQVPAAI